MKSLGYRHYLLLILLLTLIFNYQDRWALGLALQDLKAEYALSDGQLGLLTGMAFAALYSVMGIPLARWADRGNRITLMTLSLATWSVLVALLATATSFFQLLLIRMGVAIGEAGCMPAAYSLIADYFPRAERPRAVAVFLLGIPLSLVTGTYLGGWLHEVYGYRVMFVVLGAPGLLLALLVRLSLVEPRRLPPSPREQPESGFGLRHVGATLWHIETYRHMLMNFAVTSFFNMGMQQWQATFLIRSYHVRTAELGSWLTLIYGASGILGMLLGGALASRYAAQNESAQLRAMTVVYLLDAALFVVIYLSSSLHLVIALMAVTTLIGSATAAPQFALIQSLVPERMRATSIALIYLFSNLIGLGLGPLATGLLSDGLRPWAGEQSLRYALLVLCPGFLWAGWHIFRASKSVAVDLASAA